MHRVKKNVKRLEEYISRLQTGGAEQKKGLWAFDCLINCANGIIAHFGPQSEASIEIRCSRYIQLGTIYADRPLHKITIQPPKEAIPEAIAILKSTEDLFNQILKRQKRRYFTFNQAA